MTTEETTQSLNSTVPPEIIDKLAQIRTKFKDIQVEFNRANRKEQKQNREDKTKKKLITYKIDADTKAAKRISDEILPTYKSIIEFYFSSKNSLDLIKEGIQIILEFQHAFFIDTEVYNAFRGAIDLGIRFCEEKSLDKTQLEKAKEIANYNYVVIYDKKARYDSQEYRSKYSESKTSNQSLTEEQKTQLNDLIETHRLNVENLERVIKVYEGKPNNKEYKTLHGLLVGAYEYIADDEFFWAATFDKKSDTYFEDNLDLLKSLKGYYTESNSLSNSKMIQFSMINIDEEILKLYEELDKAGKNTEYIAEIDTVLENVKKMEINYQDWLIEKSSSASDEIDLAIEAIGSILDFYQKGYKTGTEEKRQKYQADVLSIVNTINSVVSDEYRHTRQTAMLDRQKDKLIQLAHSSSQVFDLEVMKQKEQKSNAMEEEPAEKTSNGNDVEEERPKKSRRTGDSTKMMITTLHKKNSSENQSSDNQVKVGQKRNRNGESSYLTKSKSSATKNHGIYDKHAKKAPNKNDTKSKEEVKNKTSRKR